jgi:pimeloyl-ACP methyl ester carboxylesterase
MQRVVVGGAPGRPRHSLEFEWLGATAAEAPTLVFLHEGLGCVAMWKGFPAAVAAATGCGALVYSRAGYGGSDAVELPRPTRYMHDEAFGALPDVLDATGVRDAILVGHSDGGSIALLYAGSGRAERVRALVLEAPHVFVEDLSVASIAAAKTAFETTDLRSKLSRHHADAAGAFRGWNDIWLDERFRAWNIEDRLALVDVPVLVVQGEDDEYGTLAQIRSIEAHVRDVTTVVLERCAHSPHRDRPDAVLDAVAAFVARIEASERSK